MEYIFTGEVRKTEEAIREEYHRILEESKKAAEVDLKESDMFPFESSSSRKSPGSQHHLAGSLFLILTTRHPGLYRLLKFGNYLDPKKTYHPNTEAQEV